MADPNDPFDAVLAGTAADAAEAARLESLLGSNPEDLDARARLLGYYAQRSFTEAGARRRKTAHCLWVIRHRPEVAIAGTPFCHIERVLDAPGHRRAKALWDRQVARRRDDVAVLANAARFYTDREKRKAASLYRRLQRLEPGNPDWKERLGHLYHLQSLRFPGRRRDKAAAARALEQFEAALALAGTPLERFYLLTSTAPIAVDAGRARKAAAYSKELLRLAGRFRANWNHGNAIHHAHGALGRVALGAGRIADAKRHLVASARTRGSPQLGSFGPGWELAAGLLERGEAKAVIRYLGLCRKFWEMGQRHVDAWTKSIRESGTTDFVPVFAAPAPTPPAG